MGDIFDTAGGYYDTENEEEEIHEGDNFNSVFALEHMPFLQKDDPDLAGIITYLSMDDLPISDRSAGKMLMLADLFTPDGGVLWHFFVLKSKHGKRKHLPLKQLCIPTTLTLVILKSFHEQGSSHKSAEAVFETIRQKYFWFLLYSNTLL